MGPLLNIGLQGMQSSYQKITQSAHQIANSGHVSTEALKTDANNENLNDLVTPAVDMLQEQHVFTASAKVVSIANETLGGLIDDLL